MPRQERQYRPQARGSSFKAEQVQIPFTDVKEIQRAGERTIRGMERIRDAEIRNSARMVQDLQRNADIEESSRETAFKLEEKAKEGALKSKKAQTKLDLLSVQSTQAAKEKKLQQLSQFSQTAFNLAAEMYSKKVDAEYEEGIYKAYTEGISPLDSLKHRINQWNLRIEGEKVQQGADQLAVLGASQTTVDEAREFGSKAERNGYIYGQTIKLGKEWEQYLLHSLDVDNKTPIQVYDPVLKKVKQITPFEAVTTEEKTAVADQLLMPYLRQGGVWGAKAEFLNDMLEIMHAGTTKILADQRDADSMARSSLRENKALSILHSNKTVNGVQDAYYMLTRTKDPQTKLTRGYAGARNVLFQTIFTGVDQNGDLLYTENELAAVLGQGFPDQPTAPLSSRFKEEIYIWEIKRKEKEDEIITNKVNKGKIEDKEAFLEIREKIINPTIEPEELLELINETQAKAIANNWTVTKNYLTNYLGNEINSENETDLEVEWQGLNEQGRLDYDTILKAKVSETFKLKWLRKSQEQQNKGATDNSVEFKSAFNRSDGYIYTRIALRAKRMGTDAVATGTVSQAVAEAKKRYRQDFFNYMNNPKNVPTRQDAHNYALEQFDKEWEKSIDPAGGFKPIKEEGGTINVVQLLENNGIYAWSPAGSGMNQTGYYAYWGSGKNLEKPTYHQSQIINILETNGKSAYSTHLLIPSENLDDWLKAGANKKSQFIYDYMPTVRQITDYFEGKVNPVDVINQQLKLRCNTSAEAPYNGICEIPKEDLAAAEEITSTLSEDFQLLVNYKYNPFRRNIAVNQELNGGPEIWNRTESLSPILTGGKK